MSRNTLYLRYLSLAVVVLLLGVAVAPSINGSIIENTVGYEDCGCEEQTTNERSFPIICALLYPFYSLLWILIYIPGLLLPIDWPIGPFLVGVYHVFSNICLQLNCPYVE